MQNVLRVSPVPPPLTPPFLSPTQPAPQPTLQDRQSPSLLQFKPSLSMNAGGGGGLESQMPVSPAHSASDKSCHTEPGIGRVREAKVSDLLYIYNCPGFTMRHGAPREVYPALPWELWV
jgi:hypothetical protein